MIQQARRHKPSCLRSASSIKINPKATLKTSLTIITLILAVQVQEFSCESKEFDWSELGVPLQKSSSLNGVAGNNLRILVSPQRRMTKNYEFEYSNGTQPVSSNADLSAGTYGAQPLGQSSGNSGHSTAYSALSASLASLKSRLNARGVSISSSMSDSNGPQSPIAALASSGISSSISGSGLYTPSSSAISSSIYGSGAAGSGQLLGDTQQMVPQSSVGGQQIASQPTYLSMASQQDPQITSSGGYTGSSSSTNDSNKTIVLAIPAKINFLADSRSSSGKQNVASGQQYAVIQPSAELQPTRSEYSTKQIVFNSHDSGIEAPVAGGQLAVMRGDPNSDQDPQQHYVLVNPSPSSGGRSSDLKGCCSPADQPNSSSGQYDSPASSIGQYEHPSVEKVVESSARATKNDDPYYNYQYRRASRARRSKRPSAGSSYKRYYRYSSLGSPASQLTPDDSEAGGEISGLSEAGGGRQSASSSSGRYHEVSPYMKYYKSRQTYSTQAQDSKTSAHDGAVRKYTTKEASQRRGRSRDFDQDQGSLSVSHQTSATDEEPMGTGSGSYSGSPVEPVSDGGRYPVYDMRVEEETGYATEDTPHEATEYGSGSKSVQSSMDYSGSADPSTVGEASTATDDSNADTESAISYNKYSSRRRKQGKNRSKRIQSAKETVPKAAKRGRKSNKYQSKQRDYQGGNNQNSTDFESTQAGEPSSGLSYHSAEYPSVSAQSSGAEADELTYSKDSTTDQEASDQSSEKDLHNQHKIHLNDTTVASLSKTTMHLKEILSILEKKAYLTKHLNETANSSGGQATSTPPPATTTTTTTTTTYNPLSILSSHYGGSSLSSSLSNDYLNSDLSLKSPYRYFPSSLTSSFSSPSLSSLASAYGSLSADTFSSLPSFSSTPYGMPTSKHMPSISTIGHPQRKRRPSKPIRYSTMMYPKTTSFVTPSSLLQAAGKSAALLPSYYSALQYPYWYTRGGASSITNSYPYKNLKTSHYSPLLNSMLRLK